MNEFGLIPVSETAPEQQIQTGPNEFGLTLAKPEESLTTKEKILGGFEAFARGALSRPVVAAAQKAFGVKPEESQFREAGLGKAATAYELIGLAGPAIASLGATAAARAGVGVAAKAIAPLATLGEFTQAGLLTKAGQAAVKGAGLTKLSTVKKLGVLPARILAPAVAGGVENALFAVADETAKAIEGNPNTAQQAIYNVGMSGVLGSAVTGGLGTVGALWKTKYGPKYKNFMSDFTGRVKDHARSNVPAADAVATELQTVVDNADEIVSSLAGSKGLKQQEIQKILPKETTAEMIAASDDVLKKVDQILTTAKTDPAVMIAPQSKIRGMEEAATVLAGELSNPAITPIERWTAINKYKQTLDRLGTFEVGHSEAINLVKEARRKARTVLEDSSVWGEAGKRQAEINKAIFEWKQKLKYVKNYIGNQVGGKNGYYVVNPDKINTIINQAKKGRGALKQDVLSDFLDATESLFKTADDVNTRLGFSIDYEKPGMTAAKAITQKLSPGMKAADLLYGQAIESASTGAGGYIGYKAGKAIGVPGGEWLGALFGSQALDPIIKQVLPVIIKPLSIGAPAASVRAASQMIGAVANGKNLSKLAADALFLDDKQVPVKVSEKELRKIDAVAREIQSNPAAALDLNDDLGQILPEHSFSLASSTINALNYVNSKRPTPKKNGVLDKEIPPSQAQMTKFRRTLEIAQNPLVVLKRAKEGTLQSADIIDLKNMYPDLYNDMVTKVTSAMITHMSNGKQVPYRVKKSLSLLAGMPLETTFTPQSIMAAQSVFIKAGAQPPQQMPQMAPKSSRKSEVPSMTETDSQRRMMNR